MELEREKITTRLDKLVPLQSDTPLTEAVRYALLTGGKRIRPILLLRVCNSFGIPTEKALDVACALEMIHAYSLIHDDLPCMDDDDERRGKPSLHKQYPEWLALLAGDFLLTKAFETIANAPLPDATRIKLIAVLAKRSGGDGLIVGQVRDLLHEKNDAMIIGKTASLFAAAFEMGGIIAGVDKPSLEELGITLGMLYQLSDDRDDKDGMVSTLGYDAIRKRCDTLFAAFQSALPKNFQPVEELIEKWWLSKAQSH